MVDPFLGAGLALVAALAWAAQYVFIRLATTDGSTLDAVAVALVCNVVIVVPLALVLSSPADVTSLEAVGAFVGAGLAGSLFGRLCQFRAVETIGASRSAPVIASTALFSTVLAVLFLGETLTLAHALGIVLIVAGVAYISWETANEEAEVPLREVGISLLIPLGAAVFFAIEPVFISWGLADGTPVIAGFGIKVVAASVGFLVALSLTGSLPEPGDLVGPSLTWYVAAGVASTLALGAYFLALEIAPVVVVVPIIQVSPLAVLVLSYLFLPRGLERVTWDLAVAASVVVAGAVVVSVSG